MKSRELKGVAALMCVVMLSLTGCGAVGNLIGGGGGNRVTTMWSDVPAMDGMTENKVDIPLPISLAIKAFITAAANSDNKNSDTKLSNFDFITYSSATKTPDDVKAFYTNEMMAGQGWNAKDQPGCAGSGTEAANIGGAFCLFGRNDGTKQSVLIIVAAQDDKSKETQLFYARFEGVGLSKS